MEVKTGVLVSVLTSLILNSTFTLIVLHHVGLLDNQPLDESSLKILKRSHMDEVDRSNETQHGNEEAKCECDCAPKQGCLNGTQVEGLRASPDDFLCSCRCPKLKRKSLRHTIRNPTLGKICMKYHQRRRGREIPTQTGSHSYQHHYLSGGERRISNSVRPKPATTTIRPTTTWIRQTRPRIRPVTPQEEHQVRRGSTITNKLKPPVTTFVRWGRNSCPGDSKVLIREPTISTTTKGMTTMFCLPENHLTRNSTSRSNLTTNLVRIGPSSEVVPCVVCEHRWKTSTRMFEGRWKAPDPTWQVEYVGILMGGKLNSEHQLSGQYCVDMALSGSISSPSTTANHPMLEYITIETDLTKRIPCVVCSK